MVRKKRKSRRPKTFGQLDLPYDNLQEAAPSLKVDAAQAGEEALKKQTKPRTATDDKRGPGTKAAALAGPGRRPRPPKLYRIGDVVEYSGKSRQTIHNYTTMGLLPESRWTKGGHRLYDESVFERLDQIRDMKAQSKSLEEIREHFALKRL